MRRLIRAFITNIPFLGRYRLLRASDIAGLQEHNRLLTEAATERARKLQERETEFAEFATESALKFQELQEHNRLLTEAATERARKLQEREAEFSEFATESARKIQEREAEFSEFATESARKLQEREAEFSELATESARKLQEREAELTNAITVMSGRLMRLTEHNRWLTETMMDGAGNTEHALLSRAVIQRLQEMEESIQANEAKPHVDGVRVQRPTPISVSIDHAAARHPNL